MNDSKPGPQPSAAPLRGLRVIELAHWLAGPAAGGVLSDWGAEVIKVESAIGDPMRHLFPPRPGAPGNSPSFSVVNRGKNSVALDLGSSADRETFESLLAGADVFLSNLRPGALVRLGLAPEVVRTRHPRLIYCSVTAYGWQGPDSEEAGYDLAGFFARAGVLHQLTPPGAAPSPYMSGVGDTFTAMSAVAGILAAIHERETTGQGGFVEASLLRTGMWSMGGEISMAANGTEARPVADRTDCPTPLFNVYRSADARWFVLVGVEMTRHLPSVLTAIGHPELIDDDRFVDARSVYQNRKTFIATLDEAFATRSLDEWGPIFAEHDVWWAPVLTPKDVAGDAQAMATGAWVEMADGGRTVDAPIRFNHQSRTVVPNAPLVGQNAHVAVES